MLRAGLEPPMRRISDRLWPDYTRLASYTPVAMSRGEPQLLFHTWDREIGPKVWASAGYDQTEMRWVLDFLGHPQRDRAVVDIGANIGTTTVAMLTEYGARYVEAFEPEPRNVRLLRCNLLLNDLTERARVHPVAVSDRTGATTMDLCSWNSGDHRIAPVDTSIHAGWDDTGAAGSVEVQAVRLDEVDDLPADIGLVWVDTQGHEASVLEAAPNFGAPWVIEYWPYALRRARGFQRLNGLLAARFQQIVDVRASVAAGRPVTVSPCSLPALAARLGDGYTDLVLIPSGPSVL